MHEFQTYRNNVQVEMWQMEDESFCFRIDSSEVGKYKAGDAAAITAHNGEGDRYEGEISAVEDHNLRVYVSIS